MHASLCSGSDERRTPGLIPSGKPGYAEVGLTAGLLLRRERLALLQTLLLCLSALLL